MADHDDAPVDARAIAADLRTEIQALRDRLAGLFGDLRYVLAYRGPHHDHEQPELWDGTGIRCDHCSRLSAIRANLAAAARVLDPERESTLDSDSINVPFEQKAAALHRQGLISDSQLNAVFATTDDAPCRVMETRTCPPSYNGPCGHRPCARFESDDPTPWLDTDEAPVEAPATDEERCITHWHGACDGTTRDCAFPSPGTGRRRRLRVLLNRLNNGIPLTADEAQALTKHVATEITEHNAARRDAEQAAAERDGAYRERGHLIALLTALAPSAVLAPAPDVDEPGWTIAYLTIGGHQASWHISPRDADLFAHVERVDADDERAQWDGHTTEEKYERIARYTAEMAEMGGTPYAQAQAAIERARKLASRWAVLRAYGGAATELRAALEGTGPEGGPQT